MRPEVGRWWVIKDKQNIIGYIHIGNMDNVPYLSSGVAYLENAPEFCNALLKHLAEQGHEKAIWQTCVGSIWEEELHKRGFRDGRIAVDVRMCLSVGSPIDVSGLRPEFDGCSTW